MSQQEVMVSCKIPSRFFISLDRPSMRRGVEVQGSPWDHCELGKEKRKEHQVCVVLRCSRAWKVKMIRLLLQFSSYKCGVFFWFNVSFPLLPYIDKKRPQIIFKLCFWQSWFTSDIPPLPVVQGKDFCWRLWLTSGMDAQLSSTGNPGPKRNAVCHRLTQAWAWRSLICALLRNSLSIQTGLDRAAKL